MAVVSSYQALIFDYGGVLAHHQTDADQARLAEIAGIPRERFTELYWSCRPDYDRGVISGEEYWQSIARRAGTTLAEDALEQLAQFDNQSWMQFDSVVWDWIDQLRAAGKRVAMLSNMPRELGEALRSSTSKLDTFDHLTLSYEVHAVKPDPVIYEHCLEGLGMSPEQTLFFDDRIANIQGAESLGIRSILFTDRDNVLLTVRT